MAYWNFPRGSAGIRALVATGAEHGLSTAACLRATGVAVADLEDPALTVQAAQELQVMRNLVAATGDAPGVGADAGRRLNLGGHDVWGFALLTSPTVGDGLRLALRFVKLSYTFHRPEVTDSRAQLVVTFDDADVPGDVRDFACERDLAALAMLIGALGDPGPFVLETRLAAARAAAFSTLSPAVQVRGGAPAHRLTTGADVLARRLPQADEQTWQRCAAGCVALLERRSTLTGTAARVRARLLEHPDLMPSMATIAAALHLDERTLRRRLTAERTSYRTVREEVLRDLASELLGTGALSVDEVGRRLGFSDGTAFARAYRRWTGATPGSVRRAPA
ncbi:MAG: AraC family transcriptional regulator [Solirubrobacterales bacterium]|nr:AraC family transcriptional regulator [Solirubrobacterales bacterium]